jgi:concanavalin A-like lectin/glucanase superfamily protein
MRKRNRREFLKQAGVGVAGMAALDWVALAARAEETHGVLKKATAVGDAARGIPPHRPLNVPGVHAYSDQQSVATGQTVSFRVSSTVPYRLTVCRLGLKVDDPAGDQVLHEFSVAHPKVQSIHPGSYVHVKKGLTQSARALTLECWVRPWKVNALAGLLSQYDDGKSCGHGLFLNAAGGVSFYLGDGNNYCSAWMYSVGEGGLKAGRWYHLVATWDGEEKAIWIDGKKAGQWPFRGTRGAVTPGSAPLRLAAAGRDGRADHFLDGDLAMPVIYEHALDSAQIAERFGQQGLAPTAGKTVLACWTFAEERGSSVADVSRYNRHGQIINHATWMIGGPAFQAEVPRFGDYDPRKDERRGHGLRFASDDLYDCRWWSLRSTACRRRRGPAFTSDAFTSIRKASRASSTSLSSCANRSGVSRRRFFF